MVSVSEVQSGWYSRYFLVPKSNGTLRPILDKHLKVASFKGSHFAGYCSRYDAKDAYIHVLYILPISMGGFGTWKLTLLGGGPDTGTVRQGRRIVNYRAFFSVRILGAPLGTDASAYQWPQWPRPQASGSMHSSGGHDPRRTGGFGTNDRRYGICGFDP